jgi:hypothetical protein
MRSKTVTMTSPFSEDLLMVQAWENKTRHTSYVLHIERDPNKTVISKSKGATSYHATYAEALNALDVAVDKCRGGRGRGRS